MTLRRGVHFGTGDEIETPSPLVLVLSAVVAFAAATAARGWIDDPAVLAAVAPDTGLQRAVLDPLSGLVALLEPAIGKAPAAAAVVNLLPPVLLLPFAAAVACLVRPFAGWRGAAVVLLALAVAPPLVAPFEPGRLDGAALSLLSVAVMLAGAVHSRSSRLAGWTAGIAGAVCVGPGGMPATAAAVVAAALAAAYVVDGRGWRRALTLAGAGMAVTLPLVLFAIRPLPSGLSVVCGPPVPVDAVAAALAGAGISAAIAASPAFGSRPVDRMIRGALVLAVLSLSVGFAAVLAAACSGPVADVEAVTGTVGPPVLRPTLP